MIGVAASSASKEAVLVAGVAALVAGSMSMAVGEYVSVSSQRDSEKADIERETQELESQPQAELNELAAIYFARGVDQELSMKVAQQLSERDRLSAPMRDELGVDPEFLARPIQAAWISAASFASFAAFTHPRDRGRVPPEPGCPHAVATEARDFVTARKLAVTAQENPPP